MADMTAAGLSCDGIIHHISFFVGPPFFPKRHYYSGRGPRLVAFSYTFVSVLENSFMFLRFYADSAPSPLYMGHLTVNVGLSASVR